MAKHGWHTMRLPQRRAQTQYFLGMVLSLIMLVPITVALSSGLTAIQMKETERELLIAPLLIGALGVVVSVMQRMTSGSLVLRYRAGRLMLVFLGGFRPLVGAVFGVLAYVLILVGLLPVRIPDTQQSLQNLAVDIVPYFLGVVAFFAALASVSPKICSRPVKAKFHPPKISVPPRQRPLRPPRKQSIKHSRFRTRLTSERLLLNLRAGLSLCVYS